MPTFGEQNPKGELTCWECGERHEANYHHEGRFNEGSIYIVCCPKDGYDYFYTLDAGIDFDPAKWTVTKGTPTAADLGIELVEPAAEEPASLDRIRELGAQAEREGDTRPAVDHPEVYAAFLAVPKLSPESRAIREAFNAGRDAERARPYAERTAASLAVELASAERNIEATRSELTKTTHARRKASLRRDLVDQQAQVAELATELAKAQEEGR